MKITNEFTVHTPIERAWQVLTDLEGIAPCMPGAQLTGVDGDVYQGRVKVKVGPVISDFTGTAQFTAKDDDAYRAVIDAKGRDARSAGNAAAVVTAALTPDGPDRTKVNVETDLKISGKLAQFGSGMIKEVSGKLLNQFVTNLEAKLATDQQTPPNGATPAPPAPTSAAAPPAGSVPAPAPTSAPASPTGPVPATSVEAGGPASAGSVAEGTASPAAVATAPDSGVALGAVGPGTPDLETSAAPAVAPDPSAGTVAASAGRLETAEGTPEPIAPLLNVPPANLTEAADSPAAVAARTDADAAGAGAAKPAERKIESAEPEALDLLEVAGSSIYKRVVPVAVGAAVVAAAVIVWFVARG